MLSTLLFLLGAIVLLQVIISVAGRWNERRGSTKVIDEAGRRLRSRFNPILLRCGYSAKPSFENSGRCIVAYENHERGLKVEFAWTASGTGWFHMVFSKMNSAGGVNYADGSNSLGVFDLAKLKPEYDYKKYVTVYAGAEQALDHAAHLLTEEQGFFRSTLIPNADLIAQLRAYAVERGYDVSSLQPAQPNELHRQLRDAITPIMSERSFSLITDTTTLPPYDYDRLTPHLLYEGQGKRVEVGQADWRDYTEYQIIRINGEEVFSVNVSERGIERAIEDLARELASRLS